MTPKNPVLMAKAGIKVAIQTDDAASSHVRSGVVFSGHPFDYRTVAELVLVNGQVAYKRD